MKSFKMTNIDLSFLRFYFHSRSVAALQAQHYGTMYSDYYFWQFEQTGPHAGDWSRLRVEMDHPFHVNSHDQFTLPHLVSAGSNGHTRIYSSEFGITDGFGALW